MPSQRTAAAASSLRSAAVAPTRSRTPLVVAAVLVVGSAAAASLHFTRPAEPDFHSVTAAEAPPDDPAPPDPPPPPAPERAVAAPPTDSANAAQLRMLQAIALGSAASSPAAPPFAAPSPAPPPIAAPAPVPGAIPADVRVIVYTTTWCPVCKRAKAWMQAHGVSYEERDVEASTESARSMRAINARGGVPTFDVEGQVMIGFSESHLVALLREASRRKRSL